MSHGSIVRVVRQYLADPSTEPMRRDRGLITGPKAVRKIRRDDAREQTITRRQARRAVAA